MAQNFSASKKITTFSDVLYSHLERLSNCSISLIDEINPKNITNYRAGINHLHSLLSPYITKASKFERLDRDIEKALDDDSIFIELGSDMQNSYISLLQKKLSLLIATMYENNLLETKRDTYKNFGGDGEDELSD